MDDFQPAPFVPDEQPEAPPEGVGGFVPDEPDTTAMKEHVHENIKTQIAANKPTEKVAGERVVKPTRPADDVIEALQAGWQSSFSGLMTRGGTADINVPDDAGRALKIASTISQLAGDLPAMAAGMVGGSEFGPVGAAAGAFAVPAAMRKVLVDHYEKGDIMTAADFSDRVVGTAWEAIKGGVTGAATELSGGLAGPVVGPLGKTFAELATMTTVSKGLEGHLPNADDFINGAIVLGGLHSIGPAHEMISEKLRGVYEKTGVRPEEVTQAALKDPILKQEILSTNIDAGHIEVPSSEEQAKLGLPQFTEKDLSQNPQKVKDAVNPAPEVKPPPETKITEAAQAVLARVGEDTPTTKPLVDIHQVYNDRVDFLHNLKVAQDEMGGNLSPEQDAYVLARTMAAHTDKVRNFFEVGTYDFNTRAVNGEGLNSIVKDAEKISPEGAQILTAYAMSKRAIELDNRGIKTGIPLDQAEQTIKDYGKDFEPIQRRLVEYRGRTLKYLKDSGYFNDKQFKSMMDLNEEHVPFYRVQEPDPMTGKIAGVGKGVRRIKGSDLQIKDPILETFKDTDMMIRMAETNRIKTAAVSNLVGEEGAGFLKKADAKLRPIDVGADEVNRALQEQGIDGAATDGLTVFRDQNKTLGENEIAVYADGKRQIYTGNPGVIQSLKAFEQNEPAMGVFTQIMKPFAQATRIGFTSNPAFALRHFIRAQELAGLTSKTGLIPFIHPALELGSFLKKDAAYRQWLFDGGAQGSFEPLGKKYVDNKVLEMDPNTSFVNKAWNTIKTPFQAAHAFIQLSDNLTRLSEYKRSLPKDFENATQAERMQAAMNSREVTPDYSRKGALMAATMARTSFFNAGIQGIDLSARAFKNDPLGATAKSLAYYTVPALLTWYATHDDERYKSLPHWERDLYLNIPTDHWRTSNDVEASSVPESLRRKGKDGNWEINDGVTFKFPQTFDVGLVFGSLPMRVLDHYVDHDPTALKDFLTSIREKVPSAPIPNALQPAIEQMTNYNFFTGTPVVPDSKRKLLPELQYTEYTSETAKALGKMISYVPLIKDIGPGNQTLASPAIIDNYIKSWGGSLGQYAVQLADRGLISAGVVPDPVKPTKSWADTMFVREFLARYPDGHAQQIQDFLDRTKKADTVQSSFQELIKQGKLNEAMVLRQRYSDELPRLDGIKTGIETQSRLVQKIQQNPKIEPDQKRQLQDGLYYQMIRAAQMGNKTLDEIEKQMKDNGKGK